MTTSTGKKVSRAYRIEGVLVLYPSVARSLFTAQRPTLCSELLWSTVFGVPLVLRALLRLVLVCPHLHKGASDRRVNPIQPSRMPTCLWLTVLHHLLGLRPKVRLQPRNRPAVDFWGVHDAEALAGVRRRVVEFFSPLPSLL